VKKHLVSTGTFTNAGYYTVDFDDDYNISEGQQYAVAVKLRTPNCEKPIAVELKGESPTENVDLTDGEGYFSLDGVTWKSIEDKDCNLCLKAFTNDR